MTNNKTACTDAKNGIHSVHFYKYFYEKYLILPIVNYEFQTNMTIFDVILKFVKDKNYK